MSRKILLLLVAAVLLLSLVLVGCQSGGIAQEVYDKVAAQLADAQAKITEAQNKLNELQASKDAAEKELKTKIAELEARLAGLQGQLSESGLVGATKAETAEKIVKYYHDTHEYSTTDLFICSDMSSEVWNMLKAQGINARIAVGNVHNAISDILLSDHAWVLAEVAPGEYLALETTAGRVVPESENPLYYKGWYFNSPADLKRHNQLVREYNVRVGIRNQINTEANEVVDEHNKAADQTTADKLKAVYDKLVELRDAQETELNNIMAEINSLAKKCGT
jgi:outer membrane murein-binding lipoprotein Lpp